MAYDFEEQEQLASLKSWWSRYGSLTTWALVVALAAYLGWTGWTSYQNRQAAQAGVLYEELQGALDANDAQKVQRIATDTQHSFGHTAYAEMAALAAAKFAYEHNDAQSAKVQLQWVIDHGEGADYQTIAKVRLAGILLDEKAYDQGLKVLSGTVPTQFAALVDDRRGDILVALGKLDAARTAYQAALDSMDENSPGRQLVHIKLDAIGGAPQKVA